MQQAELQASLEEHHVAAYGWALHCCFRRPDEAEEVLQNVYLKVLDGSARYDERASFKTWLFAVVRKTAADSRRRHYLRRLGLARYKSVHEDGIYHSPVSENLQRSQLQALFRQAIAGLPRRQQEVLHLVFYQDMTLQEAASVMAVSVGSARQHYDRGKRRLREMLEKLEAFHE